MPQRQASRALASAAVVLEVILGLGALGGGLALMLGPHGEVLPLPMSLLKGSPFEDYFGPGLILFTVLGIGPIAVAFLAWGGQRWAPLLTLGVGVAPIYLALGAAIVLVGVAWLRQTGGPFRGYPSAGPARRR